MSFGKITRKNKSGIDVIPEGYSSVPSISSNQPIPTTATVGNIGDIIVDTNGDSHELVRIEDGLYYWSSPKLRRIPIHMNAGLFDFSAKNLKNRKWYFPDGTTSTAEKPTRTLEAGGVVELEGDWDNSYFVEINRGATTSAFVGKLKLMNNVYYYYLSLNNTFVTGALIDAPRVSNTFDIGVCPQITGDIADAPRVSYLLNLYNCTQIIGNVAYAPRVTYYFNIGNCLLITGRLIDLPRVTFFLDVGSCNLLTGALIDLPRVGHTVNLSGCTLVTGRVIDIPRVTNSVNMYNLSLITGTLADAPIVSNLLFFRGCALVNGSLPLNTIATYIDIGSTGCTKPDVDLSLANLVAGHPSMSGAKTLILSGLKRTSASSANVATLISRGWSITDAVIEG